MERLVAGIKKEHLIMKQFALKNWRIKAHKKALFSVL
jgi:hypothetical protein